MPASLKRACRKVDTTFVGLGVLVAALTACRGGGIRPTAVVAVADSADQVLEGFSHYVTDQGIRKSQLTADSARLYEATQIAVLRKPVMTFFDPTGKETARLSAQRGRYQWTDGALEVEGQVVMTTPDGKTLRGQTLRYDRAKNEVATDKPFSFDRPREHLEGNSFRSDVDFKNVTTQRPRGVSRKGLLLPGQ